MRLLKILIRNIKVTYIAVRHGINPFRRISKIENKMKEKLTDKEKMYIVNNCCTEWTRSFMRKKLGMKEGCSSEQ